MLNNWKSLGLLIKTPKKFNWLKSHVVQWWTILMINMLMYIFHQGINKTLVLQVFSNLILKIFLKKLK